MAALQRTGGNTGAVSVDFDYFADLVYNHTTAMPQHRALLGQNGTELDMGDYSWARLTAGTLRSIFFWARDEIGVRVPVAGTLSKGEVGPSGVTYNITVANNGRQRQGVIAQGLTVSLNIPPDTTVVASTGTGYQGVHTDDKTKASVAVWHLPRSAPKDQERISVTQAGRAGEPGTREVLPRLQPPAKPIEQFHRTDIEGV